MSTGTALGLRAAESGLLPTPLLRLGIRRLLAQRRSELASAASSTEWAAHLGRSPVAVHVDRANDQHYELPPEFFTLMLGPHLKYSGCQWDPGVATLGAAEASALEVVCRRADLHNGQEILELGCGWGSLSLHLAERFPDSRVLAVSNSASQRAFINSHGYGNLEVVTADMNGFDAERRFDRVVSIEMFEHMRNYAELLRRIASWLTPDGRLFVHIFCHATATYPFETEGSDNWMGRYFFTGGLMPSRDLLPQFDEHLSVEESWTVDGMHYARTAAAWRENLERNRAPILSLFASVYGRDAARWYHRWRIFLLACEELFAYGGGTEWMVAHYRFAPTPRTVRRPLAPSTA